MNVTRKQPKQLLCCRTLRLVPKPLMHCLGCVLRVVVLMEDEPSSQCDVLSALEQVFIMELSVLC